MSQNKFFEHLTKNSYGYGLLYQLTGTIYQSFSKGFRQFPLATPSIFQFPE
jgi:hypothetical protein